MRIFVQLARLDRNRLFSDGVVDSQRARPARVNGLLRKFTDLAFDESAAVRWQEAQPTEADNIDVGPATESDLQNDLIEASANPF
jgi:hypothetical protein